MIALMVVAVLFATTGAALASKPLFVSKPGIVGRHIKAGVQFGVKGYVAPRQSADTTRVPVILIFKYLKSSRPRYSQVATAAAWFTGPLGKRATSYEGTLTIAGAGAYRLKAAIVQSDTVIAQSLHRPLLVRGGGRGHVHR
jgi:hypothetical protein